MVLKFSRGVYLLALVVMVVGVAVYLTMPREIFPDVEVPFFAVDVRYQGASPETMEALVTALLEDEIASIPGLRKLDSLSREGASQLLVEFATKVPVAKARTRLNDAIDRALPRLPRDLTQSPRVSRVELLKEFPTLLLALEGGSPQQAHQVVQQLTGALREVRGVSEVEAVGLPQPQLELLLRPDKLRQYGLTLPVLLQALEDQNRSHFARMVELGEGRYHVTIPHSYALLEQVKATVVGASPAGLVYLADVAEVSSGFSTDGPRARLDGKPTVLLRVHSASGANLLQLSRDVQRILAREALPVRIVQDSSALVRGMVFDLESTVMLCFVVLVLVLFCFLGWVNALLVAVAIPLSVLLGLLVVRLFGYQLNQMVLAAMIVVLGMLVDNGIVMVENVFSHQQRGEGRLRAVSLALREVGWPILSSTATTVAAFLPLIFAPGVFGRFFRPFVLTLIVTISASLLWVLTFTPVLCAHVMRPPRRLLVEDWRPARWYAFLLERLLRRPIWTLLVTLFYLSLPVLLLFGRSTGLRFFPENTPELIQLTVRPAAPASRARLDTYLAEIEQHVLHQYGGQLRALTSLAEQDEGKLLLYLKPAGQLQVVPRDLLADLRQRFASRADYWLKVRSFEQGPPSMAAAPVELEIRGDLPLAELLLWADKSRELLASIAGVVDVGDDMERHARALTLNTDGASLARAQLSNRELALLLSAATQGLPLSSYFVAGTEHGVLLRYPPGRFASVQELADLPVPSPAGAQLRLSQLAELELRATAGGIRHRNQQRVITVHANVDGRAVSEVVADFTARQEQAGIPLAHTRFGGEQQELSEVLYFLLQALAAAAVLIILVLLAEFNSFRHAMLVMLSALLAVAGVFWGLLLLGRPFYVTMSGVAVVSLAGVAVNNAIVMLSHMNSLRRELPLAEAVQKACVARLRPVLLTSLTTIVGLLPMALGMTVDLRAGWGGMLSFASVSGQIWRPMGQAMVSGMSFATVMTLVVIPCCYYLMERRRPRGG